MTADLDPIRARLAAGYVSPMPLTDEQMIAALDRWIEQDHADIATLLARVDELEAALREIWDMPTPKDANEEVLLIRLIVRAVLGDGK